MNFFLGHSTFNIGMLFPHPIIVTGINLDINLWLYKLALRKEENLNKNKFPVKLLKVDTTYNIQY